MKHIYLKERLCNACRQCETRCRAVHSRGEGNSDTLPRLRVEQRGPLMFAFLCRHCAEPTCVYACLSGALCQDRLTGLVMHDEKKCVGCWTCVPFCPYGLIIPDVEGEVVVKCDMCLEFGQPACVASCTNRALVVVEEPVHA